VADQSPRRLIDKLVAPGFAGAETPPLRARPPHPSVWTIMPSGSIGRAAIVYVGRPVRACGGKQRDEGTCQPDPVAEGRSPRAGSRTLRTPGGQPAGGGITEEGRDVCWRHHQPAPGTPLGGADISECFEAPVLTRGDRAGPTSTGAAVLRGGWPRRSRELRGGGETTPRPTVHITRPSSMSGRSARALLRPSTGHHRDSRPWRSMAHAYKRA